MLLATPHGDRERSRAALIRSAAGFRGALMNVHEVGYTGHREPHRQDDFYWWLEVRHGGREQRAAASNGAPDGV
jgi:hypothetical protein